MIMNRAPKYGEVARGCLFPLQSSKARGRWQAAVLAAILTVALSVAPHAGAQATSGSIVGHVTDSSGALIPGADVTATNVDTHITFHGVTDKAGTYDLLHVTPGSYEIRASHAGFATQTVPSAS